MNLKQILENILVRMFHSFQDSPLNKQTNKPTNKKTSQTYSCESFIFKRVPTAVLHLVLESAILKLFEAIGL